MKPGTFAYIWRYNVKSGRRAEFLAAYGKGGAWEQFFSQDPAYLETTLLEGLGDNDSFITVDYWESKQDRDLFLARRSAEYSELDDKCEELTVSEEFVGEFSVPRASGA